MSILWIVIIGTSLWMAFDAKQIGYDKKDVKGMAGIGPVSWFFGGLLLWIVVFPLYLASRSKLKAAASAGASTPTGSAEQVAQTASSEETESGTGDGKAGMSPLRQKLKTAVGIFFGGWAVLALSWNLIGSEPEIRVPADTATQAQTQANAAPAGPRIAEDGSLVGLRSEDGTSIKFTRANGEIFVFHTSAPYYFTDAKVFPGSVGVLDLRSVTLSWEGNGPGRMTQFAARSNCVVDIINGTDDCIPADLSFSFAVEGELKQARGVRIDVNQKISTEFESIFFTGFPESLREVFDSAENSVRSSFKEIATEYAGEPWIVVSSVRRELDAQLDAQLESMERDYQSALAEARTSTSVEWEAL